MFNPKGAHCSLRVLIPQYQLECVECCGRDLSTMGSDVKGGFREDEAFELDLEREEDGNRARITTQSW